jgi:hypothetical protein
LTVAETWTCLATTLSQADVGRPKRQIAGSGQDVHIAILPDSAGDPVTVLRALNDRIGGHGVVGVVVGRYFRAGADRDAGFSVGDLAREAVQSHRGDAPAALTSCVASSNGPTVKAESARAATVAASASFPFSSS